MTIKLESYIKEEDGLCASDLCSLHLFSVSRTVLREAGREYALGRITKKKRKSPELLNRRGGGC